MSNDATTSARSAGIDAGEEVIPFTLAVEEAQLEDLRDRLGRTRWPPPETVPDWSQGVPLGYLRELSAHWASAYDWRAFEQRLNATPQFKTSLDGLDIQFLHARSPHADALPLLLTHGWPGSIREFLDVIKPLTHSDDPADAFHVVCPSLPGFGFSQKPDSAGWNVQRIAAAWSALMARLGYDRYGAHGGDWGAVVTARLGAIDPDHVAGIHLTIPMVDLSGESDIGLELSAFEQAGAERLAAYGQSGTGYLVQQMTRPQTLGYGLSDSPVAQLAWILEKFHAWTDCRGNPENAISRDAMLDDVMLYWLPNTGTSAARLYWESFPDMPDDVVDVPAGCSIFPMEHVRVPRAKAETRLNDVRYWNELSVGGHFPALEQPSQFVEELRAFFRLIR